MTLGQISNPKGAFGATFPGNPQANIRLKTVRNISTAFSIPVGCVVHYSTLTTDGLGVTKSTVIGNPLTAGVALTSATTCGADPVATSLAPDGTWFQIVTEGPARTIVTSATSPGDLVQSGNSTAFGGTTAGAAVGITTGLAIGTHAVLGRLIKASADTNSTGQLGVVDVLISHYLNNAIST